ncbi:NYN domain-containing protein, partial [Corynebacterium urinipleomorphum]|uniref:NYN domain-containing protein n=1 Tax=Corynebacterium urinipleomorphum TaxID=1852380 RepID=UPI001F1FAC77
MLERTLVFVDTSYLLASFYNSWETGARSQLEIDLPEVVNNLSGMITQQLHQPIHRQFWYDGIPDSGPHRYQRALRTCDGVQLRTGQLIEWGERRTQKGVDTRLVADIVVNAMRGQCTDFVLVSGDADMIPGVEEATNAGIRVHLYGFGWDSMSSALRHACDSTTILDPREDFAEAMQLQVLEGPLPPTIRERPMDDAGAEDQEGMCDIPRPDGEQPLSETAVAGDTLIDGTVDPSPSPHPESQSGSESISPEDVQPQPVPEPNEELPSTDPVNTVNASNVADTVDPVDDTGECNEPSESDTAEPSATNQSGHSPTPRPARPGP